MEWKGKLRGVALIWWINGDWSINIRNTIFGLDETARVYTWMKELFTLIQNVWKSTKTWGMQRHAKKTWNVSKLLIYISPHLSRLLLGSYFSPIPSILHRVPFIATSLFLYPPSQSPSNYIITFTPQAPLFPYNNTTADNHHLPLAPHFPNINPSIISTRLASTSPIRNYFQIPLYIFRYHY